MISEQQNKNIIKITVSYGWEFSRKILKQNLYKWKCTSSSLFSRSQSKFHPIVQLLLFKIRKYICFESVIPYCAIIEYLGILNLNDLLSFHDYYLIWSPSTSTIIFKFKLIWNNIRLCPSYVSILLCLCWKLKKNVKVFISITTKKVESKFFEGAFKNLISKVLK